ncbi:MAG: helix-turn-helix domain-containing protein [Solirubrobacterales bacterium]
MGSNPTSRTLRDAETHSREIVTEALRLRDEEGFGARRVARRLGIPPGTVRDWHAGKLPRHSRTTTRDGDPIPDACPVCNQAVHQYDALPSSYVYLLGLYLGDGSISSHPRRSGWLIGSSSSPSAGPRPFFAA